MHGGQLVTGAPKLDWSAARALGVACGVACSFLTSTDAFAMDSPPGGCAAAEVATYQRGVIDVATLFNETAQNPVLRETIGLLLIYYNIPSLPQLPASSALLKLIWPRMECRGGRLYLQKRVYQTNTVECIKLYHSLN